MAIKTRKRPVNVQGSRSYDDRPAKLEPLLEEDIDYLIRTLRVRQVQVIEKNLADLGLALSAWYPLSLLASEDGISQRELGLRLGLKDAAIGKAIEGMQKAGLVTRATDANDRRKILVHLTAKGRKAAAGVRDQRRKILSAVLLGFNKAEVGNLKKLLKRYHENLLPLLEE